MLYRITINTFALIHMGNSKMAIY